MDKKGEAGKRDAAGYRIETCKVCKRDWGVSAGKIVPPGGYVCPSCERRLRPSMIRYGVRRGRSRWNVCENCGCFLDPGEVCDCETEGKAG